MANQNTFINEPKSSSTIPYTTHQNNDLNCNFFNPNWENSIDQNDPFESALSSMVSSPTATSNNGGENNIVQLRELIGRLGSICNSTNTSCYSTPLNSPPKLNLSTMENQMKSKQFQTLAPPFSTDPGFAQRAAKFSCFANNPNPGFNPILQSGSQDNRDVISDSMDNSSSVLEQNPGSRKRKSIPKGGKGKDTITPPNVSGSEKSESSAKKSKSDDKKKQENSISEDKKDYIHVRARRGQATDAHSLAERVRREKISERMKFLQDLVPGCNKVTGKAVMLDEIINYVQSLQRQVEFLSMKLATVDPRMDLNTETLMSKDIFQSRGSLPRTALYSSDFQQFETNNLNAALGRNQLSPFDNFNEGASQVSTFWEDDLHSIVQMGFGQNQTQNFQGIIPTTQMKVEL